MRRYKLWLIPILVIILSQLFFLTDMFQHIENKAYDSLFRIRGRQPISKQIAIVAIDDATFRSLNMQWPFPRELYARAIHNLERAGARQIIFDIEFTENSKPEADAYLADNAAIYKNIIFAGKSIEKKSSQSDELQILPPIAPLLQNKLNWGTVNISQDDDGFVRRYTLFNRFGKEQYYSIAVAGLANWRVYQSGWQNYVTNRNHILTAGGYPIPIIEGNKTLINYFGPANTYPTYSFSSVIDDETYTMPDFDLDEFNGLLEKGVFKDKVVLIGSTVDELHDNFLTPFTSGDKLTPGVEIHANFLDMVFQRAFLHKVPYLFYFIGCILLAYLLFTVNLKLKPAVSGIISIVLIFAYLFACLLAFKQHRLLLPVFELPIIITVLYIINLLYQYLQAAKEKRFIKGAFQHYMAPKLVEELLKNPKALQYGGSIKEVSVLFSDIRSFTTYTESHTAEETVAILKEYLTAMVDVIIEHQGTLDKFVGDEIMALYGAPLDQTDHALLACRTAIDMRQELTKLQDKWRKENKQIFEIGIGINTGIATVGNLGSAQLFDYTAIGDTINLGARLESINKEYDTMHHIIISEFTLAKVQDWVKVRYLDDVTVKGKTKPVKIYELIEVYSEKRSQ